MTSGRRPRIKVTPLGSKAVILCREGPHAPGPFSVLRRRQMEPNGLGQAREISSSYGGIELELRQHAWMRHLAQGISAPDKFYLRDVVGVPFL